jgi:hypothetical protein
MEYLSHMEEEKQEDEIRTVPLDVLREFLVVDVVHVQPSRDWIYSENISF